MTKYRSLTILLCLLLAAIGVEAIAKAPIPYCSSKPVYKQFPLAAEQILTHDMSNSFSGYNLNITLATNVSFASISAKWGVLDRRGAYFPNIISHYVQMKDNTVNKDSFLLYKDLTGSIHFTYGVITDKGRLPDVSSTAILTTDKTVTCYDAALFLEHGLAIIDCVKSNNQTFSAITNYFYVLDLTTHTVKTMIQNDMFVPFTKITRRKLLKFSHPEAGGFTYMLRVYFHDAVDSSLSDNTYMQIFSVPVEDPTQLQIIRVIDRTFLNVNKLKIADADIYMDDIFLLDYETGLFRLDILQSQRVQITARYKDFGFERFGVYSDDLDNELIIALSNRHNVYQINWANTNKPVLINKYSLMQSSNVKQINLNNKYVIVQSSALASNETNPKFQVDYTWIFSRGSRTYMNAYHVINHNSSIVDIEFDKKKSHLYIADQKGLTLRTIEEAKLVLHFNNASFIGTEQKLISLATSTDFNSKVTFTCQQQFTVLFVSKDNTTIFPTGMSPTDIYSTNYPGQVRIQLDSYFMGAQLDYKLTQISGKQMPQYWVDKINRTRVSFDKPIPPNDITFFHTDVIPQLGQQVVIYYYEDTGNHTHIAECIHMWEATEMKCFVRQQFNHTSKLRAFTTAYFEDQEGINYYYIMVLEGEKKTVLINNFIKRQRVANITYTGGIQSEITSLAASNGILYVLRKYQKTIDAYLLARCAETGNCTKAFTLDYSTLKGLGVQYFAPEHIYTDFMHPEVLFIKCLGSLIILDVDNKQKLHLLDQIIGTPATNNKDFKVAVNKYRLLLVAPGAIEQYSLQELYTYNMVILTKILPTYGMVIQPNADVQFSDFENTVYVNAVDPKRNVSVVLIYRTGYPGTNSLYHILYLDRLYSRPGFQIQVSGYFVDFVSIIAGGQFHCYRVFQYPSMVINNTFSDFSFKLNVFNNASNLLTNKINISVVNTPSIINSTQEFEKMQASNGLKVIKKGSYEWQDRDWFTGSLIHYNYSCVDCHVPNAKVRLREHIDNYMDLHVGGNSYTETLRGGISVWNDLFRFRPNGSVYEVANLPDQKLLEKCVKVAASFNQIFAVTACQELGRGINLYVTSFASFKAFTWGPFYSSAYQVQTLQIVNDLLMVADTPTNPEYKFQKGAIFIYRVSFNHETEDEMNEIEVIDSNDFVGCHGWNEDEAYLSNAHLLYSGNSDAYRLYVTEVDHGLFIIDFTKPPDSDQEINVISTTYVDLREVLQKSNLHMPDDAIFQGVTWVKSIFHPHFDTENMLVTTKGYHNFEFTVVYDDTGHFLSIILHRIYYRYAFYNTINQVHASNGFIALGYTLPPLYSQFSYRKQYVALYDSIDYPNQSEKGYSERFMLAGFPLNTTSPAMFSINTTYDYHSNGTRSGLIVSIPSANRMISTSVAHNLTLTLQEGYKTQDLKVKVFNDFKQIQFTTKIVEQKKPDPDPKPDPKPDPDDDTSSVIIIIIIVLCSVVIIFFGFYVFSVARKSPVDQQRESLLTENQTIARQSLPQNDSAYAPPTNADQMRREPSHGSDEGDDEADNSNQEEDDEGQDEAEDEGEGQDQIPAVQVQEIDQVQEQAQRPINESSQNFKSVVHPKEMNLEVEIEKQEIISEEHAKVEAKKDAPAEE